jgi:hypothetical protein
MPLILAIVADHHQAAQITALVKRLNVDLVQAAEVGEGLLALNDRIPDLVLTSPLMSPFDDGVLDEYLRDLGPAGAHVQSLRIPVLGTSSKKSKGGGFSLFGRSKATHTLEGCDPKVFADEITQYLMRAAEEKQNAQDQAESASRPLEAVPPGDEWATTPGQTSVVEDEERWDPLAWQADVRSTEPAMDTPAPVYSPIAAEEPTPVYAPLAAEEPTPVYTPIAMEGPTPVYTPIAAEEPTPEYTPIAPEEAAPVYAPMAAEEPAPVYNPIAVESAYRDEAAPALAETPAQEAQAADAPAADVYVPEPAIETPKPSWLIGDETPPAAPAFDATAYTPIEEGPDPVSASVLLPEPSPDPLASVVLPEEPSPDPDEPVVRAPLSLFEGVEAATDPSLFLPSEEPTVRGPEPLTLFRGVEAITDPTEYLRPIAAEPFVAEPIVAAPVAAEPVLVEPVLVEPVVAAPVVAEPVAAEPVAAEPVVVEPVVAAPVVAEPVAAEPVVVEPVAAEPAEPIAAESFVMEPVAAEPIVAEPIFTEPIAPPTMAAPEPIALQPPVVAAVELPDPPAAPPASPAPVAEKPAAPKLTASFRAALAAIRKAWDAPHAKAAPPVEEKPSEATTPAREEAPIPAVAPTRIVAPVWADASDPAKAEAAAPLEPIPAPESPAFDVDLTGDVELIDSEPVVEHIPEPESQPFAVQPLEPPADAGLGEPAAGASDVYEITVDPDLQELESTLLAPLEPSTGPSPSEEPVSRASETAPREGRGSKDAPRSKRGKSSKKGKAASAKPRRQDKEPVQDEWGIFDPERCGFAALVDKLEEVSEEKEQTPRKGTKVRVISYS